MDDLLYSGAVIFGYLLLAVTISFCMYLNYLGFSSPFRTKIRAIRKLASYFNGNIPWYSFFNCFKGEYRGLYFSVSIFDVGKDEAMRGHRYRLFIRLYKKASFKLKILVPTITYSIRWNLPFANRINLAQPGFEKDFNISSDNASEAAAFLQSEKIVGIIKDLFKDRFEFLLIDNEGILIWRWESCLYPELESAFEPRKIEAIIIKLYTLAQHLR
jgi:hypothetical protein